MRTTQAPFSDAASNNYRYAFAQNNADQFMDNHSTLIKGEMRDLLTCMFQNDPDQRLSMAEVWGHPWMKGSLPTELEVKEYFRAINEFYHAERGDAIVEREELLGL